MRDQVHDGQLGADGGFDIEPAEAHAAIAHDDEGLLAGSRELGADAHTDAVADAGVGTGIEDAAGMLGLESLGEEVAGGKAIEDDGRVFIEDLAGFRRDPGRMDRLVVLVGLGIFVQTLLILGLDIIDLLEPVSLLGDALLVVLLDVVNHLLEDGLRVADDDLRRRGGRFEVAPGLGDLDEFELGGPGAVALEEAEA